MGRKPTAYILNDWENNGYHDSDFFWALWVPSKKAVVIYKYDTTRFAGRTSHPYNFKPLTANVVKAARKYHEKRILNYLREQETERLKGEVMFSRDQEVRLVKPVTFKDKRRPDADGKPTVVKATAGETGTVIWAGHYGKFYRNGYNRPDRSNQRIGIKFADGRVVFCAASKAVLVINDPKPDSDLVAEATRLSYGYHFKGLVSTHGGWLSSNAALAKAQELGLDKPGA